MCTIVKDPSILIKCSNPSNADVESITCMALESATRSFHIYMIWIYANKRQLPEDQFMPFSYLQSTLADTLNHFPILAGRLTEDASGNGTIHLNNAGVLFTEARCMDKNVHYFFPHATSDDADAEEEFDYEHINSADLEVAVSNTWTGPMMSVQATRLQCGSVILSVSAFHCLMDAQSTADLVT